MAIIVILLLIGAYFLGASRQPQHQAVDWDQYPTPVLSNTNTTVPQSTVPATNNTQNTQTNTATASGQASWYKPNTSGWVEKTLTWKTYSTGNASFSYPPSYVVKTSTVSTRPGVSMQQTTITNPNNPNGIRDTIYLDVPYTGANDPSTQFNIRENVNGSGLSFSLSYDATEYTKYIFENLVASAKKN